MCVCLSQFLQMPLTLEIIGGSNFLWICFCLELTFALANRLNLWLKIREHEQYGPSNWWDNITAFVWKLVKYMQSCPCQVSWKKIYNCHLGVRKSSFMNQTFQIGTMAIQYSFKGTSWQLKRNRDRITSVHVVKVLLCN